MKKMSRLFQITLIFFISYVSCSTLDSSKTYSEIISSQSYIVKIHYYHGSVLGRSSADLENPYELLINKKDSTLRYSKNNARNTENRSISHSEIEFIETQLDSLFLSHNPSKVYEGCCMCSNYDYELSNGKQSLYIRPQGSAEGLIFDIEKRFELKLIMPLF